MINHTHTHTLLVLVSVFPHYTQQRLSLDQSSSQWLCLFTIVVIFFFSSSSFFSFSFSLTAANHSTRVVVAEVACLSWLLAANLSLSLSLQSGCQQTISSLVNQVSLSLQSRSSGLFLLLTLTHSLNQHVQIAAKKVAVVCRRVEREEKS